jgi:murein DD-endopeptidase MepM/ murein hydrolase activator NlpD
MIPVGSHVYAVRAGTVARIVDWPHNCARLGRCDETCGVGLSIDGHDGARWIYCHGSRLNGLSVGVTVSTGQLIMWSGDTGRSGAPHLHVEIRVEGQQRCSQEILNAIYRGPLVVAPQGLSTVGCAF